MISIITTVYNGANYIDRAIPSILKQIWSDFEWIIVDDGSTDNTIAILNELTQKDSRIRLIVAGRLGRAAALNLAVNSARGEFIANQDFDDTSVPERLELQYTFLRCNESVACVGGYYIVNDCIRNHRFIRRPPTASVDIRKYFAIGIPFAHTTVMFRKAAWEEAGGYPIVDDLEDFLLWVAFSSHNWQLVNLPVILGEHYVHSRSFWHTHHIYWRRQVLLAFYQLKAIIKLRLSPWAVRFAFARVFYGVVPYSFRRYGRKCFRLSDETTLT